MSDVNIDLRVVVGDITTSFWLPERSSDHVQRVMWKGEAFYEYQMLSHSKALLAPGDEVIDVGAYIGNHTLFYANVCGAKVFAFEPNQAAFDTMMANVKLNGLEDSVTAVCAGVGANPARASLVLPEDSGNAGMCQLELTDKGTIEIVRLDDQEGIRCPKLIKIDVEGMELAVLLGAKRLIAEHHPLLYVESPAAAHFAPISKLLLDWGYLALAQFNATTTICFVHSSDATRVLNEQINYFQYDLRQQLARINKRVASTSQELSNHFDQFAETTASALAQESLSERVDALASSQRELAGAFQRLEQTIRQAEDRRREEDRSAFGYRTGQKLRKARRDPRRFVVDSSGYKAVRKLIGTDEGEDKD